jgi:phospholipid/cholesterol/gamma-HCH transport system substrate-binding protein
MLAKFAAINILVCMKKNLIETLIGALVLLVAGLFINTAINSSGVKSSGGYEISAKFDRIDGVGIGSDVRIGGIKIGTISSQSLDNETYRAKMTLQISDDVKLPTDTSAEIASESLLGGKYVSLIPGAMDEYLQEGDEIEYTQSSINIEQLIGKFAFGGAEDKDKEAVPAERSLTPIAQ